MTPRRLAIAVWIAALLLLIVAVWVAPATTCVQRGGSPRLVDVSPWARGGVEVRCTYGPPRPR